MKRILLPVIALVACLVGIWVATRYQPTLNSTFEALSDAEGLRKEESKDEKAIFTRERARYEYSLLKDVSTGKIPYGIYEKEMAIARSLPTKQIPLSGVLGIDNLNTYIPAGPTNIGGRTRAIA